MKVLENRIPPPLVALIGAAFDFSGLLAFIRRKTTVNPLKPERASALVTGGVFRFTRNPMYVGMLLFLLAWGVYLDCLLAFAGPVLFVLYMNRFQIGPEERVLREKFGAPFEAYLGEVRRWL